MTDGIQPLRSATFGDLATGRDNNLNLLRMAAATAVLFSHSYALTGRMADEPLTVATAYRTDTATLGVVVFFAISGFLIAQSLERRRSLYAFTVARVLRIVPGLLFAKLACVFAIGWYATSLAAGAYWRHPDTWRFLAGTPFFGIRDVLPGVFGSLPFPRSVNGSLWTIPVETWCYTGAATLAAATILFRPALFTLVTLCAAVMFIGFPDPIRGWLPADGIGTVPGLVFTFVFGAWVYVQRRRIPVSLPVAAGVAAWIVYSGTTPLFRFSFFAGIAYVALVIAYHPRLRLTAYLRAGDYSYGTYVLAFPIQQFLVFYFAIREPLVLFAFAGVATLPLAALSWHMIEKPALALKGSLAAWRPRLRYGLRRITRS